MGKLFVFSASSGAGKTTVVNKLIKDHGERYNLKRLITYTSRPIRGNEINGKDYHFLSQEQFLQKTKENFFIEWSTAYTHYYGSSWDSVKKKEKEDSLLAIVDYDGAREMRKAFKNDEATFIWIHVPLDVLKYRLINRGEDSCESIERRLSIAKQELQRVSSSSLFDFSICNEGADEATSALESIFHNEFLGR